MTPSEAVAKMRALLDAATKGTWQHDADEGPSIATGCAEVFIDDEEYGSINVVGLDRSALPQDAKAITASHNVLPALLAVVEAADNWLRDAGPLSYAGNRAQVERALAAWAKAVEAQK